MKYFYVAISSICFFAYEAKGNTAEPAGEIAKRAEKQIENAVKHTKPVPVTPSAEVNALVDLYNAANGNQWNNANQLWYPAKSGAMPYVTGPTDISNWYGITLDASGYVVRIRLAGNNLTGSLPTTLSVCKKLEVLELSNNNLTGSLEALGQLPNLEELILTKNQLSGSLSGLSACTKLRDLYVEDNQFTFTDIAGIAGRTFAVGFYYSPQDMVDTVQTINGSSGTTITLSTSIDQNITACTYQWFKQADSVATALNQESTIGHTISYTIGSTDGEAKFYYKIRNPAFPDLTLTGRSRIVSANDRPSPSTTNKISWNAILNYTPSSPIPSQPSTTITISGCDALLLSCSPANPDWYWQTSDGGEDTSHPSTHFFSAKANTPYYLRAYNGSRWSAALSYRQDARIPVAPSTAVTATGCESISITCSPSDANWYWQTAESGTDTSKPSTIAFSVNAEASYYLRAYNGNCWSAAFAYRQEARIPVAPSTAVTATGCESISITCNPSDANWYWQTTESGTDRGHPSTAAFSVNAEASYYLRAYNGNCWSAALSYRQEARIPVAPSTAVTATGCESISITCSPSDANWYWQTAESGTDTSKPSTIAFSVNAEASYYLRAYNGNCWSAAFAYRQEARIPVTPSTAVTATGCGSISVSCAPTDANWYWQTTESGTDRGHPSSTAFSVNAEASYYLRAYNGNCWSAALSYRQEARIPVAPSTAVTATGCESISITCSPSDANWYWQTTESGTDRGHPSSTAFSVNAEASYYLRAYNGNCWSAAFAYRQEARIPVTPSANITANGCESVSITCSPSDANWYWQTIESGTDTSNPSIAAFSVNAEASYYLRAYNGNCWSAALAYRQEARIPVTPSTAVTATGCGSISVSCAPTDANWYWQTTESGTDTSKPSTAAFSVNAEASYYLRAYNGNCWSAALAYKQDARIPVTPSTAVTATGCESVSITCSPSDANWYWQTAESGTDTSKPSTAAFSVNAEASYYLRAYNGNCWSAALAYRQDARIPVAPSTAVTATGCESVSITCNPSDANWYWQTTESGTDRSHPSTTAFSVNAEASYYLRAYNGNCWSAALSYRQDVRIPVAPSTVVTATGCGSISVSCAPTDANWYWQTTENGTDRGHPSATAFSVNAEASYYLRAYNGNCWSAALTYRQDARIPVTPSTAVTANGCENVSITCSPSDANWYWQTTESGTDRGHPSAAAFSVNAEVSYYLRAYNGNCWSAAFAYRQEARIPVAPSTVVTATGCESVSITCNPSDANWYWQTTENGTDRGHPSTTAFSVNAEASYYLRAYNGNCWSAAFTYRQEARIPVAPSTAITANGCESISITCNPSDANWYWQTTESGTDRSHPSTTAFSVNAEASYYLRAYNGNCWSAALSYRQDVRIPVAPSTVVTATGCGSISVSCAPTDANWYWQTTENGTDRGHPSATAFSVNAEASYYLRAYNGNCWSAALSYRQEARIPVTPSTNITATGCESVSITCSPNDANWYWQTTESGTDRGHPSTAAFSVNAEASYYLRAYNGNCWSAALTYRQDARIPVAPSTAVTATGCESVSITCSPSDANWYWQTTESGTDRGHPSSTAFSVNAEASYYLRAYNGNCWSAAITYRQEARIPVAPSTVVTATGCGSISVSCAPTDANWYWQTTESGTDRGHPSSIAFSVNAEASYYLRAYNGNCWSAALTYRQDARIPVAPSTAVTATGCGSISVSCAPTDANWYWQTTESGTDTSHPSTAAFSVNAEASYYLRAYNGNCWSAAFAYRQEARIPVAPSTAVTATGCESVSITCNPSDANWYWQTTESGTDRSHPSTTAFSVNAEASYYLRAYNGNCWSAALSYRQDVRIPVAPSTVVTATGCGSISVSCAPTDANWYWQTTENGTDRGHPSTTAFSVNAEASYYLRAYNGNCWSAALSYRQDARIPVAPSTVVTATGCGSISVSCAPTDANWYWQTTESGTDTSKPSTAAFSVNAEASYYLRAYNGNCWSAALTYRQDARIPVTPSTAVTATGCESVSITCSPSDANWYWQTTESGTDTSKPSTAAFSVNAEASYYLRAYNGNCWSAALSYRQDARIPVTPSTAITATGCESISITCSPSDANWYWQTTESGTDTSKPSTAAFSVNAEASYYLRAYNGNCWSAALAYRQDARIPVAPSTAVTATGCESVSITCNPSDANWYWQTTESGTDTSKPSTTAFSVNAEASYYLRAYNGNCWSAVLAYRQEARIPVAPSTAVTATGCESVSITCSPSDANWYWQTTESGTDTSHPSTAAFSVNAEASYYLRAYNGNCWSAAFAYRQEARIPVAPSTAVTATGCESISITCSPSDANWYWQTTESGTDRGHPSAAAFSVNAEASYYLRAYNGNCWSAALSYRQDARIPVTPSTAITATGCESISITCSPSDANWYWQTTESGTDTSKPSTAAFSVNAEASYYLRAYNGNCWSAALAYRQDARIPVAPSTAVTATGCESVSITCNPSDANWYWQTTESGTDTSKPSTTAFSVNAEASYYLRAYNGNCWSTALAYRQEARIPVAPSTAVTATGCESVSIACSPSDANWYWQTTESGTDRGHPSTTAFSVNAEASYYLRAYNGNCWSAAFTYRQEARIPVAPSTAITANGCESISITCNPSDANWYWQTTESGTDRGHPSTAAFSVNAEASYYLRAYNGNCWSAAFAYRQDARIPVAPSTVVTATGCGSISVSCAPTDANWYWQTTESGTDRGHPSTAAFSVNAEASYYLRAYNGNCWSAALTYRQEARIPVAPSTAITATGCENVSITCNPSDANWYWETIESGTDTSHPSTATFSVNAEASYYLRAYNGNCWSAALSYRQEARIPVAPSTVVTATGCGSISVSCAPSDANWYWQTTENGTDRGHPSTTAFSVNAEASYYLRAYNGNCWSAALAYRQEARIPVAPSTAVTATGCGSISVSCAPTDANWYWETIESGTDRGHPSTAAFSVNAEASYYLRAYNGNCWSAALSYRQEARIPVTPSTNITATGCENVSITCNPSDANWYWQTTENGTDRGHPSTAAFSVNAEASYYLRAYNGNCWSAALAYRQEARIPVAPSTAVTATGCESLSITCNPSLTNWYWQAIESGTDTSNPSTTAFSVDAEASYYLRAYNENCWSAALSYRQEARIPAAPSTAVTATGCESVSITCNPSDANWYWQTTESGTNRSNPSTTAFSVNAEASYYLRAYNGNCWSAALAYRQEARIPVAPSTAVTATGCGSISVSCAPSDANWYWQTTESGTDRGHPSAAAFSVNAEASYYLRAYNGNCWSAAFAYRQEARIPVAPSTAVTATGCESISITCNPSDANWYWQTAESGTDRGHPSSTAFSVNAEAYYYLRAYNGNCWSAALTYRQDARIPVAPSTAVTATGCGSISVSCAPTGANWYWQTAENGTDRGHPSSAAFSVNAEVSYYLRAYNGNCWSAAFTYRQDARIPVAPSTAVTATGCESVSITCSPSDANWCWQTTESGTDRGHPSSTAFSVNAEVSYYLRAYNGNCWSAALSYRQEARIPVTPSTAVTATGCESVSITCSPSDANWYWQTTESGTDTSKPSTAAFSVNAEASYYLRAYNGNCWSAALSYRQDARIPVAPSTAVTATGCENVSITCSPSDANWYWQTTESGTDRGHPSSTAFSVNAEASYYLRAYNGNCWSAALAYRQEARIPVTPSTAITANGCESVSITCNPSDANWYWQTTESGTDRGHPSTAAFSVNAEASYYLRAYNGNCWSAALTYRQDARIPVTPSTAVTATGCESVSITCSPSDANWYWQTTESGTDRGHPSTAAFSVNAEGSYYLRAYNGNCWSAALTYRQDARIPVAPSTAVTATGCGSISVSCAPTGANWYWQTAESGTDTSHPSTAAFSVNAEASYYLRAYNGNCWSAAFTYRQEARIPVAPSTAITATGCENVSITCNPSDANWYWETIENGTDRGHPSSTAFSVNAEASYYLRAYNGNCWSAALTYRQEARIPVTPSTAVTATGCGSISVSCAPTGANWYWQTAESGTDTSHPSTAAFSVNAEASYYLRAYNGNCWSAALTYRQEARIPVTPSTVVTATGCGSISVSCAPTDANWYWQTTESGTDTSKPSTTAFSVNAEAYYYLRAYNGNCWSAALSYRQDARIPVTPSTAVTATGCESVSITCSPSDANWYWQTTESGTDRGHPSATAFSVNAEVSYYLRAYNGNCWSAALSYRQDARIPVAPSTAVTANGCESVSITCSPSDANWYWQTTESGTNRGHPSTTAFSVNAEASYYLRAYNGNCWSAALSYPPSSPPAPTITTSGCADLRLTCSPTNTSWYWQTTASGTDTSKPSTTALRVKADTAYYLRPYKANCWGRARSYTPTARQPLPPSTTITANGCETISLTCSPGHTDWYWQTSSGGTVTDFARKSTSGYTVRTSGSYYLRAYNAATQCWSVAVEKAVAIRKRPNGAVLTGYDFCENANGKVALLTSQTGVKYQLRSGSGNSGNALDGTGAAIQWIGLSENTYWVVASYSDASWCTEEMPNRVPIKRIAEATTDFNASRLLCAIQFTPTSNLSLGKAPSYQWEFGDTKTSNNSNPMHTYTNDGTYTVTMTINYFVDCAGRNITNCPCGETATKQVTKPITTTSLLEINPPIKDYTYTYIDTSYTRVLASSVSTFHNTWPNRNVTDNINPYFTGEDGVWRTAGSYVYKNNRAQSEDLTPATDGAYTMEQFNWRDPENSTHWLKTEEVMEYNSFSKPTLVEDALQVPTSALYDYGGYLQSAQGVNMKNREMAFTGFEYMNNYEGNTGYGRESGNWNFGLTPVYVKNYYLAYGAGNWIFVKAPLKKFENVNEIYVRAYYTYPYSSYFFNNSYYYPAYRRQKIICKQASKDKKNTYLVVEHPVCEEQGFWQGTVSIPVTLQSFVSPNFSKDKAHTGKTSLLISRDETFPQEIIRLDSGRSYCLSAWVNTEGSTAGIDVLFKDKNNIPGATFSCLPKGPIIEGWQQIRGTFICPKNDTKVSLIFKKGQENTYYDDLRLYPTKGNMESYVYDVTDYKLLATLDAENFATLYYYDAEGQLRASKKETTEGMKTLSETIDHVKKKAE